MSIIHPAPRIRNNSRKLARHSPEPKDIVQHFSGIQIDTGKSYCATFFICYCFVLIHAWNTQCYTSVIHVKVPSTRHVKVPSFYHTSYVSWHWRTHIFVSGSYAFSLVSSDSPCLYMEYFSIWSTSDVEYLLYLMSEMFQFNKFCRAFFRLQNYLR